MKRSVKDSTILKLKVGSAEADPQEVLRQKRLMKGAKRRMMKHKTNIARYRKIIGERAVLHISKDGQPSTIHLGETDVEEYRMKRLKEEAAYMAASRDYNAHREMFEDLVGSNSDGIREILRSERAAVFANRNSGRYTALVMEHLKKGEASGDKTITNLLPLTQTGHRKEFREAIGKFVKVVDPKTSAFFENKPKLYSRVIENLIAELGDMIVRTAQ